MLGNNADAFFTTPMKTSVTTQPRQAAAKASGEMPAPRPTSQSATTQVVQKGEFLPGMGDMLPGMGEGIGGGVGGVPWWGLGLIAGGLLMFTKSGKKVLRSIGV